MPIVSDVLERFVEVAYAALCEVGHGDIIRPVFLHDGVPYIQFDTDDFPEDSDEFKFLLRAEELALIAVGLPRSTNHRRKRRSVTHDETAKVLTIIRGAYPMHPVPDETAMLWANAFARSDYGRYAARSADGSRTSPSRRRLPISTIRWQPNAGSRNESWRTRPAVTRTSRRCRSLRGNRLRDGRTSTTVSSGGGNRTWPTSIGLSAS